MLIKMLQNSNLWIRISHSDFYKKYRHPKEYKNQKEEFQFYKTLILELPFNADLIFDVGANIGVKSKMFSKLSKRVLAFEPSSKLVSILKSTFKNSNVEIFNCALGKEIAILDYYEVVGNEAYNSLSKKHIQTTVTERNIADEGSVKTKKVQVEKIENFIKQYGVPVYIKIDVEGYEYEVIQGLETPVPLISFELNLPEFSQESIKIIEYLSKISSGRYHYNFTTESSFLLQDFINSKEAVEYITSTQLRYLEVYARLGV